MVFRAALSQEEVRIMIDSGANQNYVSRRTAQKLTAYEQRRDIPYPVNAANGKFMDFVTKQLREVPMTIGKHTERISLDIVDLPKYDVVLGMAWLHDHNPTIDWKTRTLEFPLCSTDEAEDRSSSKVPIARAIWVRPVGRSIAEISQEQEIPPEYKEFKQLFEKREGSSALPEHKPWDHKIEFVEGMENPGYKGWKKELSRAESEFFRDYIRDLEAKSFIRKQPKPRITHGVLFAPKKDKTLRPCIDFRPTNAITKKNVYPLPLIQELQNRLGGKKWFTALDVRDAYYRVRMAEGEEWKTAFLTNWGVYEYLVMPFGLTNAPATFQALIEDTLQEYLDDFALAYLDDILIYSDTYEEHVEHVKKVMRKLQEKELPLKLSKCEFHKHEIAFLGYLISDKGLAPDPAKVKAVEEWPEPRNVKDVQSFLGLANYYRKFVENFSKIAGPLTNLTKKDTYFDFGSKCKEAFKELKRRLTSAPILGIFDPDKETIMETDASDEAIGATLNQKGDDGKLRPTAYYSRKMTAPETNYDIHDKELLAIVEALRHWRVHLEGAEYQVQILTDHKNLLYWTTTKELNRRQVRWAETLASYDFKITYVKGTENGRADALSRRPDYMGTMKPQPASILQEKDGGLSYRKPEPQTLMIMTDFDPTTEQRQQIIESRHDQKTAGHKGVAKTIELITRDFTWKGLRKDVEEYIRRCDICCKTKNDRHKPYGLLQSPEVPEKAWQSIALDFVTGLPESEEPLTETRYDSIMVVNDRLTKYAYMIPFLKKANAQGLAYTFTRYILSQHGIPKEIISDRDKLFTSGFWQSLMDLLGTKHKLSTAFHPQTDGQTERTNQTMEQYLRCYVNYQQNDWVELLPMAQFAFNNSMAVTGVSPFYANYGQHPNIENDPRGLKPIAERARISVKKLQSLHKALQRELLRITKTTTKQANKKRSEGPDLQEGEMVYLRRKNIKTTKTSEKLDHVKLGPYKIKEKKGPVTFELELPDTTKIHPVFHKSLLEPCYDHNAKPEPIDIQEEFTQENRQPECITDAREFWGKPHYLVHWLGTETSEDTWEPPQSLTPEFLAQYHHRSSTQRSSRWRK